MGTRTARQIRRDAVFNHAKKIVSVKKQKEPTPRLNQAIASGEDAKAIVQGLLGRDLQRDRERDSQLGKYA